MTAFGTGYEYWGYHRELSGPQDSITVQLRASTIPSNLDFDIATMDRRSGPNWSATVAQTDDGAGLSERGR